MDTWIEYPGYWASYMVVGFLESIRGRDSSIGATIVEKDGRALLRVVYLGDFEDMMERKDSAKYVDCSYSGEGWVIEDMQMVKGYYSKGKIDEILDFRFIYD